jgi:hypothetical protein
MFERRKVDNIPTIVEFKWSPEVVDEGYIPFPKRLVRCLPGVFSDVRDLQVVLAVVDYARPNLTRPPSYEYLAFIAGMDVITFKERIRDLERRGWITTSGPDEAVSIKIDGILKYIELLTNDGSRSTANSEIF